MTYDVPAVGPHVTAFMERLRSSLPGVIGVSLGVAPTDEPPFIVVYPDSGEVDYARLCATRQDVSIRFIIHGVGIGAEQVIWAHDHLVAALAGHRLEVPGRTCFPMNMTLGPSPLRRDSTTQPPLWLQVSEFQLWSQPGR